MAGTVKVLIDRIIKERSGGNPTLVDTTRTKLILKGIDPNKFSLTTNDDPVMIKKVKDVAREMGINL